MSLEEIKNALLNKQLIISVLTVIISIMILMLFKRIINRRIKIIEKQKMHNYRKRKTYLKLLNHISPHIFKFFSSHLHKHLLNIPFSISICQYCLK